MTYNFDPEGWLERMLAVLQSRLDRGDIDAEAFEAGRADLERRYDEMVERLDGSYQLPGER